MFSDTLNHPADVIAIIRRETEFGSIRHDCRQGIEGLAGHKAAVLMAPLWPRVRKQDKYAIDRRRSQRRDHQPRVIGKNSDVVEVAAFDMHEQPGNSWLEYLAADEADLRMAFGLNGKMLTTTKTDLKPNWPFGSIESSTGFQTACLRNGQNKPRQQFADPDFLPEAKPPPAAAAEDQLTLRQPHNRRRLEGAPQLVHEIEPLPREAAVGFGLSTEMAIGRRTRVDRFIQGKMHADAARRQVH
jgi:hypothetical protein